MATILVLLSSLLPFANNLIKRFVDTSKVVFDNVSGARNLDLDSCIFFLSMPISYAFIAIGALSGAHKYSFYAVLASCYFQLAFIIKFIFLDVNDIFIISEIALFVVFIIVVIVLIRSERLIKKIKIEDDFKNKTLDRFTYILTNKNENEDDK